MKLKIDFLRGKIKVNLLRNTEDISSLETEERILLFLTNALTMRLKHSDLTKEDIKIGKFVKG